MEKKHIEILLASAFTLFVFYASTWFTDLSANLETLIYVLLGITLGTIIFYKFKDRKTQESS